MDLTNTTPVPTNFEADDDTPVIIDLTIPRD